MTIPEPAPRHPQSVSPPGGLHYSWVIVGILVVVQVIGSAISQSAGIMVARCAIPTATSAGDRHDWGAHGRVLCGGRRLCPHQRLAGRAVWGGAAPHAGGRPAVWQQYAPVGAGPAALALPPHLQPAAVADPVHLYGALMAAVSGWFRRRLGLATGILWAAGLGAAGLAPLVSVLLDTGLAGHLLEPRGHRRRHHPVADPVLPQSPCGPGPHALWGDRGRPARGGAESGGRAAAPAGLHPADAAHARLLVPAADPRPGLRRPWHCAALCGASGGRAGPHAGVGLGDSQPHLRVQHWQSPPHAHRGGALGETDHRRGLGDPGRHGAGPVVGARGVDISTFGSLLASALAGR